MRARKYDKAITIMRTTPVSDGFGGFITTEAQLYSGWANIVSKQARITNEQGQNDNVSQYVFTVRNRYDIDVNSKTDFIRFNGNTYQIDSILNLDLDNIDIEIYGSKRN
jgi:head-tail adaptor